MQIKRKIFPPIYLLLGLLLIAYLHTRVPLAVILSGGVRLVGLVFVLLGVSITLWAGGSFRRVGTPLIPFRQPEALVVTGLFRYTRNPMYLGMLLLLIGVAWSTGTLSPWLIPPLFVVIIHYRFILGEEALLREVFGDDYSRYRSKVRRWL
jgi:protein-S-isoprenylcysteine O-methyltransferase Ste14